MTSVRQRQALKQTKPTSTSISMEVCKLSECLALTSRVTRTCAIRQRARKASLPQRRIFNTSRTYRADDERPGNGNGNGGRSTTPELFRKRRETPRNFELMNYLVPPSQQNEARRRTTTPQSSAESTDSSLTNFMGAMKPSLKPISAMMDPQGRLTSTPALRLEPAPFKLGPTLGRTVHVDEARGRDVGAAFRALGALVRRNRIPQDSQKQRFHERPGLKRKRLKSERYRARFKEGFHQMVTRVQAMKRMGW